MRVRLNAAKSNSIFFHRPVRERYGPKKQKARSEDRAFRNKPGDFLLSHTVACAVPSGLRGLTSVFGMGTGGTLSLRSPRTGRTAWVSRPPQTGSLNTDGAS